MHCPEIDGAQKIGKVWIIPYDAKREQSDLIKKKTPYGDISSLAYACSQLGVSLATGKNWVKLGKLTPSKLINNTIYFDNSYISSFKAELESGDNASLKSRRNKKYVSGSGLYSSYVSSTCKGLVSVSETLNILYENKIAIDNDVICLVVADAALKMLSYEPNDFSSRLAGFLSNGCSSSYAELISDLITDRTWALRFIEKYPSLFAVKYTYEPGEDVLGLLYISCQNISKRKSAGSYYTPSEVADKLISNLNPDNGQHARILDPCCGTGNFLLRLPLGISLKNIFGNDTDEMCVKVARINMALKYRPEKIEILYENFTVSDFLLCYDRKDFDIIIGNPPWGSDWDKPYISLLKKKFKAAKGAKPESYDVILERALECVKQGGRISFVLPEALLNVKSHKDIRERLLGCAKLEYLNFLGNVFDGVTCPCVIMKIRLTGEKMSCKGAKIVTREKSFKIAKERDISSDLFPFFADDDEYDIIKKMDCLPGVRHLKGNADFALGIVTGDNKKYLSSVQTQGCEPVLKGTDIFKYGCSLPDTYINFAPDKFQQTAPVKYYRAGEKLLYRFICDTLVFAYDTSGTLPLNSCNVLIPHMDGLGCKYVLAVLNSRPAGFYFKARFNSVKVLRSHIEHIPVPDADKKIQGTIAALVDKIMAASDRDEISSLPKFATFTTY